MPVVQQWQGRTGARIALAEVAEEICLAFSICLERSLDFAGFGAGAV